MKKKILAMVLAGLLVTTSVSATNVVFTVGSPSVGVLEAEEYKEKSLEAAPFINAENRTMVPVRAIAEAFGAEVGWNGESRTVTVKKGDVEISLVIDRAEATVCGEVRKLDTCPTIVADRTMVPLRFIGEALNLNVQYVSSTKQILIDDSEPILTCGDKKVCFSEFKTMYDIYYLGNLGSMEEVGNDKTIYGQAVAYVTLQKLMLILGVMNAFPSLTLSAEEQEEVRQQLAGIEMYEPQKHGYIALAIEKEMLTDDESIIRWILENEDVKAFYEENYVSAKHILVFDEETANAVYEKAIGGADFDALVREYGQDPGMTENPDGYIFTKGEMVEEFEEAAFAAAVDEITKPVKTDYGYHIIKRLPLSPISDEIAQNVATGIGNAKLKEGKMPELTMEIEALYEKLGVNIK